MSEKLPRVTANEMIKIVERSGFRFSRQSGSHKIYKNAGLSVGEFKKMLKNKNNTLHHIIPIPCPVYR